MADTPILLREQQYHQIKAVLARLRMDASAKVVFLVDKDGQEIASQGEVGNLDTTVWRPSPPATLRQLEEWLN